jgi:hypothetical protein
MKRCDVARRFLRGAAGSWITRIALFRSLSLAKLFTNFHNPFHRVIVTQQPFFEFFDARYHP